MQTLLKKLGYHFLAEGTKIENATFPYKTVLPKWKVKNGPSTNDGVLTATTLFFQKFRFSLRSSYKELF